MKAMASVDYGPLDQLKEVDLPAPEPRAGEVRVRVMASALNPADYKVLLGNIKLLHGRQRPLVLGYDFSGTVEAVGDGVTKFSEGDDVFGFLPYGPGNQQGAFAEALVAKVEEIAKKPAGISHAVAAASATTGLTALQSIRDLGRLPEADGSVLVTGVSGGVGSIAVPIARRLGARVTAVGSGNGLETAKRLGATRLVDRTENALPAGAGDPVDVFFDAAAAYRWSDMRAALKPGGAFISTLPSMNYVLDKLQSLFAGTRVHLVTVRSKSRDLELLATWLSEGLEVILSSTIDVRDVAKGLAALQAKGGRIAVRVQGGF